jgi:hypothetical protein
MQLCFLKSIKLVSTPSHARMRFTNVTLQLKSIHFLIKSENCKAITFRRLDVSLSSVRIEGLILIDNLDK